MAKTVLVLAFSLTLVLSIRSVVGEDALSPEQIDKATTEFKEITQSLSHGAGNAAESVKETASSLTDWAKDKLRDYGWLSPKGAPASAPVIAPAPALARAFGPGPGPAAAPIV
ncbi:uncharacterized protein LOC110417233 [Herrania umbratica]|uniref:Uncharacterized protein LOC110417233 n=1 Tax=Herrania umbratica TaxID=108875 RepID=A0A6J1AE79_9ROSI|nr:uncharacterized protein LOC110417233 [Herrania umbratica]